MRRAVKIKASSAGVPLRKAAVSANSAARRPYPAWIDAGDSGVAFSARSPIPRVRDGLVLRTVSRAKGAKSEAMSDGRAAR